MKRRFTIIFYCSPHTITQSYYRLWAIFVICLRKNIETLKFRFEFNSEIAKGLMHSFVLNPLKKRRVEWNGARGMGCARHKGVGSYVFAKQIKWNSLQEKKFAENFSCRIFYVSDADSFQPKYTHTLGCLQTTTTKMYHVSVVVIVRSPSSSLSGSSNRAFWPRYTRSFCYKLHNEPQETIAKFPLLMHKQDECEKTSARE